MGSTMAVLGRAAVALSLILAARGSPAAGVASCLPGWIGISNLTGCFHTSEKPCSADWVKHEGMDCYPGRGALAILPDPLPTSLTLEDCKAECLDHSACRGVVTVTKDQGNKGKCYLRRNLRLQSCSRNTGYTFHLKSRRRRRGGCSWLEAVEFCGKLKSRLIELNSPEKFKSIIQVLGTKSKGQHWWVGASDSRTEGTWLWENSQTNLSKSSHLWEEGRPHRFENALDCALLDSDTMKLVDEDCSLKTNYKQQFYGLSSVKTFAKLYPLCETFSE